MHDQDQRDRDYEQRWGDRQWTYRGDEQTRVLRDGASDVAEQIIVIGEQTRDAAWLAMAEVAVRRLARIRSRELTAFRSWIEAVLKTDRVSPPNVAAYPWVGDYARLRDEACWLAGRSSWTRGETILSTTDGQECTLPGESEQEDPHPLVNPEYLAPARARGVPERYRAAQRGRPSLKSFAKSAKKRLRKLGLSEPDRLALVRAWCLEGIPADEREPAEDAVTVTEEDPQPGMRPSR